MPPLSFFRSSHGNGSSPNINNNVTTGINTVNNPNTANTATSSPTTTKSSIYSGQNGSPSPVRQSSQQQREMYPQPLVPNRLPTPPSPRTNGGYVQQTPGMGLRGQGGGGGTAQGERGLGFPLDSAGPGSGYYQDEANGVGVRDGQGLGEFGGIGADKLNGSGRFGSGSFGRVRKAIPSASASGSPSSTSNQTIFMNPPGTPTRASSFPREQEELTTPRGGSKMGSIAEGIPFTAPPVFGGMMMNSSGDGLGENNQRGPRSAGLIGSFPISSSMRGVTAGSSSHMHHRSLSIAPSSSSLAMDMPPPSPRARPPKPRGYSESGNVEKRRAGWFAGLVAGSQGTQGRTSGSSKATGVGEMGTGSAVSNGTGGTTLVEGEPRTRRLGSGSSILSNPFSSSKDPETHSNQSHGPRGSMDDESGPPVGRSVSLRRGFRNRVSSAGTVASSTPSVGGLSISGPIGPMVKATHEEILQEFGRLNPDATNGYELEAERAVRSASLDQGLKLRANSFSAAERPSFSSGSLDDNKDGMGFKLAARVVAGTTERPTSTVPTMVYQRPVTPERTQLAQIPGTPVAQIRSETPSNPGGYPTPLSPPTRKPMIGSRSAGPPPVPFAWPSRGVEAGCLSPRNPSRSNSFEVNMSPRDFPGTTFRPSSPAGAKPVSEYTEWLARKPSTSLEYARELGRPLNLVRSHDERIPKKKPAPLLSRSSDSPMLPHLRQRASDESEASRYATSGVEADEDSEEQLSSVEDAVIARAERVVSPRKDSFSSNAFSTGTSPQSPSILPRDQKDDYYVETVCVPSADKDTMRWEVIIRRRLASVPNGSADAPTSSTGPVQLSETRTVTKAPSTSSSLNLSLSLDNPRGKLAFLSLPSAIGDPHATPVRSRSTVQATSGLAKARVDASPGPSPSPSPSPYSIQSGFSRFESTRTNSETSMTQPPPFFSAHSKGSINETRRQLSEAMPASPMSPGAPLTPVSPPASPRETVVRQRRKASLQGGVLYTRNLDTQV